MIPRIKDYSDLIGKDKISEIKELANPLKDRHVTNINSVYTGGGVAEIMNSLILLMNDLKINVGWRILKGSHSFFDVTKRLHNALQGEDVELSEKMKEVYKEETLRNSLMTHFDHHDLVVVHDPQPLALIEHSPKKQPWVWRCHIDITEPNKNAWNFLLPHLKKYDAMVVSMDSYKKNIVPEYVMAPSIDPLSAKNKKISEKGMDKLLSENGIDPDKKIITQISRFDKWKDPLGVVRIWKNSGVKSQLVLMGDMAADDPEGQQMFVDVVNKTKDLEDVHIITKRDDFLVNALQAKSDVVLQNSHREGFALTVSEALWKETPVIARPTGGIPLQVIEGETGFLYKDESSASKLIKKIVENDSLRKELGEKGKNHVLHNFLITRQVRDYLNLYQELMN